ncbi:MAG TPA: ankyrin repeat domain-containing protein [Pyrinomonadaceae bacterium]|nr:ankyrin repeat domain-containing protein [Pyrinomonadaceae bacterium]
MAVPRKLVVVPNAATRELWRIAESGAMDELEAVLPRADINARNEHGMTALMRAAYHGRTQMVRALLDHGADPNLTRNDNFTALSLAAFFGHAEIVGMLMQHGANTDVATRFGTSPYQWAKARSFGDVARCLEKRKEQAQRLAPSAVETEIEPKPKPKPGPKPEPEIKSALPVPPPVVRTLKEPPEIWDLVHEAPRNFNASTAFMARMGSVKAGVVIGAALFVVISGGAGAAYFFKHKIPSFTTPATAAKAPVTTAAPVTATTSAPQAAGSTSTTVLPTTAAEQPSVTSNPTAETAPIVEPEAPGGEGLPPATARRSRAFARSRAVPNDFNNEQTDRIQTVTTPPDPVPPKVDLRPADETRSKSPAAPPVGQQVISAPKNQQPKAKVIQWP